MQTGLVSISSREEYETGQEMRVLLDDVVPFETVVHIPELIGCQYLSTVIGVGCRYV